MTFMFSSVGSCGIEFVYRKRLCMCMVRRIIVVFFIQEIMKTCDGGIHLSHFVELYSLEADGW